MKKFTWITRPIQWLMGSLLLAILGGCGGDGGSGVAAPAPGGGLGGTAPVVTAVAPMSAATGVPVNIKKITASFSKAMDPATLTAATFTVACPTVTVAGGVVSYLAAGNVATLTLPAGNLPVSTQCTATVNMGARDATGVALAASYVWKFTTGVAADTTPPIVALTVPVDGVTGVATNTLVAATFSEDMDPATIIGANFTVVNTTAGGTAVAGAVSYSVSSKIATFTPAATLPASSLYTVTMTTAVADMAGNLMTVNKVWTFTTGTTTSTSVLPGIVATPKVAVRLEFPSAAAGAAAGAAAEPPPPQPAIIAVIRMVMVHTMGVLIRSNLFILFLLGKSNQKILATTLVCYVDLLVEFVKLCNSGSEIGSTDTSTLHNTEGTISFFSIEYRVLTHKVRINFGKYLG